ncbi:DUF2971 domain-containing protein [Paenibacillus sp. R14(2021)]|uniref:DUF2971 domain-containing protein n=1 Tax=Paenibacillus sp. R14(2021) TaxID=2859228 RepID=UPI001C6156A9|nr:DUF2971 domain-containing protein [Paenibacillus sp. R14(2021)]
MSLLYRYYSVNKYSLDYLAKGMVSFNDLHKFNDPFEGLGHFYFDVTPEEQEYWDSIGSNLPMDISNRFAEDSKEMLRFKNRILCVTEKYDNPLMWAHYASAHSGFCVGYAKQDIMQVSDRFDKVKYEQEPNRINSAQLDMKQIDDLLFMKSKEWKYEEEWRSIYTLRDADIRRLAYGENFVKCNGEEDDKKLYMPYGDVQLGNLQVLESDKYILKQCAPQVIYLGLRMKPEDRAQVIEIAKANQLSIFQMSQRPNSFRLDYFQLNW